MVIYEILAVLLCILLIYVGCVLVYFVCYLCYSPQQFHILEGGQNITCLYYKTCLKITGGNYDKSDTHRKPELNLFNDR